jgi:glutamate--cysteine ligase
MKRFSGNNSFFRIVEVLFMTESNRHLFDSLAASFVRQYIDILSKIDGVGHRTYGIEYEFLPARIMDLDDMTRMYRFLASMGMRADGLDFVSSNGIHIAFEPGGQIEYNSPPLKAIDAGGIDDFLSFIAQTNALIRNQLHIVYEARGFAPGRAHAPLCLISPRYRLLHDRLKRTGTRGLEMMKGTASIHLHVRIAGISELLRLFYRLCEMATSVDFRMSPQRREIWDNTDPMRCGLPPCCNERLNSAEQLIDRLIRFALAAEVLGENVPFHLNRDRSFDAFLYHMTTLFTDVRFNLKGPTLELRTLDSIPIDQFREKWQIFVSSFEDL